jgi:hypothetical protein
MPGLSIHPYGGEVIFLVNSNATMNYTYQPNCSGSDGHDNGVKGGEGGGGGGGAAAAAAAAAAIKVPLWSVSIVDGKSCAVVFNSAAATVAAYDDDDDDTHHRLAKASDGGTDGGRTGAPSETWWAKAYRLTPIFR